VKILIVDDHPIVRSGLRRLLAVQPGVEVCEAASGREALTTFKNQRPDLVILDLNLPDVGGLEIITRLKTADPEARIIVLSMHSDRLHARHALQAGAAGYVSKNIAPDELLQAIALVRAGSAYIEREIAEELALSTIRTGPSPLDDLSARDLEILRRLAQGRNLAQIADALGVSYKTAANNCTRIKTKLNAATTADLIRIALGCGLADPGVGSLPGLHTGRSGER
jgi:two-component system, NarL family, invasion response regulator UvrY